VIAEVGSHYVFGRRFDIEFAFIGGGC